MIVLQFKAIGKQKQYLAIEEAMITAKIVRNSCIRYWMDNKGVGKLDLNKYCTVLAHQFPFANELNSMVPLASAERAWLEVTVRIVEPYFMSFNHASA
ncbi:hypothetical protein LYNGBM3L_21590 [Moorena producens 3L]|uniref:Transposase n=1 Tax=Moorena producens 3L TaxID=489825 RepID=F4XNG0_9CYAN|nr:hypothetical protein LYNGBM3L_21590 [Moorena producens 3L]OLT65759.1 transposase [Moorena producens 3L]